MRRSIAKMLVDFYSGIIPAKDIIEDYEQLQENEQDLYALCKEIYETVNKEKYSWPMFQELVGHELADKLETMVQAGADPRIS